MEDSQNLLSWHAVHVVSMSNNLKGTIEILAFCCATVEGSTLTDPVRVKEEYRSLHILSLQA